MNWIWPVVAFVLGASLGAVVTMALVSHAIRRQFRNHFWS